MVPRISCGYKGPEGDKDILEQGEEWVPPVVMMEFVLAECVRSGDLSWVGREEIYIYMERRRGR